MATGGELVIYLRWAKVPDPVERANGCGQETLPNN
jgi:hypothetical protein